LQAFQSCPSDAAPGSYNPHIRRINREKSTVFIELNDFYFPDTQAPSLAGAVWAWAMEAQARITIKNREGKLINDHGLE
jgi:hypothetical protein